MRRGAGEIVIGNLRGIREGIDYGDRLNQRLHAWPYRKLITMLKDKGALAGIVVRDDIDERNTSARCYACGRVLPSNRKHRGCQQRRYFIGLHKHVSWLRGKTHVR